MMGQIEDIHRKAPAAREEAALEVLGRLVHGAVPSLSVYSGSVGKSKASTCKAESISVLCIKFDSRPLSSVFPNSTGHLNAAT